LTEHTLESVIEPALFDKRLCFTELSPKGISIAAMEVRLDHVEVDRRNGSEDINEIRFPTTMELGRDEYFPVGCSCCRRPSAA
jgi:hypothetical protein